MFVGIYYLISRIFEVFLYAVIQQKKIYKTCMKEK